MSNKFNAKRTEYGGRWYHSKSEASYAMELDWRVKAGEILEWIPQFKIALEVNGIHITDYFMDFKVIDKHGGVQFHEVKGARTAVWTMKFRLLEALIDQIEPGAELVLIQVPSSWKQKPKWTFKNKAK